MFIEEVAAKGKHVVKTFDRGPSGKCVRAIMGRRARPHACVPSAPRKRSLRRASKLENLLENNLRSKPLRLTLFPVSAGRAPSIGRSKPLEMLISRRII